MSDTKREHVHKADLLDRMRGERAKLDALFEQVPDARMTLPGAMGAWSLKDMLAHILCYETWIEAQVDPVLRADLPPEVINDHMDDTEERNQLYYRMYRDRSVGEVRDEAKRVFERVLAAVEAMPEEGLNQVMTFDAENNLIPVGEHAPDDPEMWTLGRWVAYETYEHYPDHLPDLEAWVSQG